MPEAEALLQEAWTEMNEDLRDSLKAMAAEDTIDREAGEFSNQDAVGIFVPSLGGTKKRLRKLVEKGRLTVRIAYDPRRKVKVNAYKIKEE
jgi:hypothetical protein